MRGFKLTSKSSDPKTSMKKGATTTTNEQDNNNGGDGGRGRRRRLSSPEEAGEGDGGEGRGEQYVHCALLGDGMVGKTCLTLSYTQQHFTDRYTATVFDNYPVPVSVGGENFTISVFDTAGQRDYESVRAYTYQSSEVLVLCFSVCDRESFYSVVNCWLPEIQRHLKGKRPLLLVGTQIDLRRSSPSSDLKTSSPSSSSSASSVLGTSSPPSSSSSSASFFSTPKTFFVSHVRAPSTSTSSSSSSSAFSSASPSSFRDSLSSVSSSSSSSSSSSLSDLRRFSGCSSPFCQGEEGDQDGDADAAVGAEVSAEEGDRLAQMIGADCYIECSARSGEGVEQVFQHVVFSALKYRQKERKRRRAGRGLLGRLFRERPLSGKALRRVASTFSIPGSKVGDPR